MARRRLRRRLSRRYSRRNFKNTASRVHRRNLYGRSMRGGYRL